MTVPCSGSTLAFGKKAILLQEPHAPRSAGPSGSERDFVAQGSCHKSTIPGARAKFQDPFATSDPGRKWRMGRLRLLTGQDAKAATDPHLRNDDFLFPMFGDGNPRARLHPSAY